MFNAKTRVGSRKFIASVLAMAMTVSLIPSFLSVDIVLADTAKNQDNTCLGTSGISSPIAPSSDTDPWTGSYVYFGSYNGSPIKFRVLSPNTSVFGGTTMFLDSDSVLVSMRFDDDSNSWCSSEIRSFLNGEFYTNSFTSTEQNVIHASSVGTHDYVEGSGVGQVDYWAKQLYDGYIALTDDKVFLLDLEDAENILYGYSTEYNSCRMKSGPMEYPYWWLRTSQPFEPSLDMFPIGHVSSGGTIFGANPDWNDGFCGAAPALNINLSSVLFSTSISGDLGATGTEYKLTLTDDDLSLFVQSWEKPTSEGNTITVTYEITGDDAANATRASVLILDKEYGASDAEILYYDALGGTFSNSAAATGTFTLPSSLDIADWGTEYYVYILAEDVNGSFETDYASTPVLIDSTQVDTQIAIDETNFPDEAFRQYVLENCDTDGNEFLNDAEISNALIINVNDSSIQTLEGINYFTSMTYLYCRDNQLTDLDVSGCKSLMTLVCSNNQLTSLNVSGCSEMTSLSCDTNELTSLDIDDNTALVYLDCSFNKLTALDVSGHTALINLECSFNDLTDLKVSECSSLTYLECGSNSLNSLDLDDCTALSELTCGSNNLNSLDVSDCTALTVLSCGYNKLPSIELSNNTLLARLGCNNNLLTSLELDNNTALTYVYCPYNQLTNIVLSDSSVLRTFDCSHNKLESLNISGCTSLDTLVCNDNLLTGIDVSSCTALSYLYCYNNLLKSINISSNDHLIKAYTAGEYSGSWPNIPDTAVVYQDGYALIADRTVRIDTTDYLGIAIDETNFPDPVFRQYVKDNYDDGDGYLTDEEISAVTSIKINIQKYGNIASLQGVEFFTELTKLECYSLQLTELDVSNNTKLQELSCDNNKLQKLDLTANVDLTKLSCGENQLTELDISGCVNLTNLYCDGNKLTELNVSNNTALTNLSCCGNELSALDISKNTELTQVRCSNNQITELEITNNTSLTFLDCRSNQISELDLTDSVLTNLWCWNNNILSIDISSSESLINTFNTQIVLYGPINNNVNYPGIWVDEGTLILTDPVTVTYFANEHGAAPDPQTVNKGSIVTEPEAPTAEGWTFVGWYTDSSCTQVFDFATAVTANVTLYAKWTKTLTPGWNEIDGQYYYADQSGELLYNSWIKEGSKTYYVGPDGARVTGRQKIDGEFYYFKSDGRMVTGWKTLGSYTYYFDPATGKAVTGWQTIDGAKYYFKSNWKMETGWKVTSGGTAYYLDPVTGKAATGLTEIEGKTYYFSSAGKMQTGFVTIGNYKYYFGDDGVMLTGRQKIDGEFYYFKTNGRATTGWKVLGSYTYYFDPATGKAVTGWQTIDGYKYYFKSNGKMQTGWKETSGGTKYYFDTDGKMVTGWKTIDGVDYYFNSNGKLVT